MIYLGLLRKGFGSPTLSQWIRHWSAKATHPTLVATTAQLQFHSDALGFGKGRGLSLAMYSTQLNKPRIKQLQAGGVTAV